MNEYILKIVQSSALFLSRHLRASWEARVGGCHRHVVKEV